MVTEVKPDLEQPKRENREPSTQAPGTGTTPGTGTRTRTGTGTRTRTTPGKNGKTPADIQREPEPITTPAEIPFKDSGVEVEEVSSPFVIPGPIPTDTGKKSEIGATALVILAMVDGLAISMYGPQAAMTKTERDMITAPLERLLARFDIVNNALLAKYIDPILLLFGIMAWGMRINREVVQPKKAAKAQAEIKAQAQAQAPQESAPLPTGESINTTPPFDIMAAMRSESL